jgi:MoaA/NifB/PqqE/SkfB family radical SAM enzyme
MSDMTNGNKGIQAYRWLVTIGMALITALSWRQLDQIDKMAAKLEALQIQVTTLSSTAEGRSNASAQRLDTAERRNDRQDQQIEELQRRLWQIAPARSP